MNHYQRQLLINAPAATVYRALATQDGLRSWWTEQCDAEAHVGGHATFRFGATHKVMQITALKPEREVRWHCVGAQLNAPGITCGDEWKGTELLFKLTPQGTSTLLDFEHIGLTPALQCYAMCDTGWQHFLASLKMLAETGAGMPYKAQDMCAATVKALAAVHEEREAMAG